MIDNFNIYYYEIIKFNMLQNHQELSIILLTIHTILCLFSNKDAPQGYYPCVVINPNLLIYKGKFKHHPWTYLERKDKLNSWEEFLLLLTEQY